MTAPLVALSDISRSFGDVRACDGISLSVEPGEIHALLGENGAGKSTLVRIHGESVLIFGVTAYALGSGFGVHPLDVVVALRV